MTRPQVPAIGDDSERPPILVEWERAKYERDAEFSAKYGVTTPAGLKKIQAPPEAWEALSSVDAATFGEMYEQLTPLERMAERDRRHAQAEADPNNPVARLPLGQWNNWIGLWQAYRTNELTERSTDRSRTELRATELAEKALERCAYLGGFPDAPLPVPLCSGCVHIATDGNIHWADNTGPVCGAKWHDVVSIRVGPADRASERFTAPRLALLGPIGLAFKKLRREAMLAIRTTSGEGLFIVQGHTPLELEAQLAPLVACIGVTPADAYSAAARGGMP